MEKSKNFFPPPLSFSFFLVIFIKITYYLTYFHKNVKYSKVSSVKKGSFSSSDNMEMKSLKEFLPSSFPFSISLKTFIEKVSLWIFSYTLSLSKDGFHKPVLTKRIAGKIWLWRSPYCSWEIYWRQGEDLKKGSSKVLFFSSLICTCLTCRLRNVCMFLVLCFWVLKQKPKAKAFTRFRMRFNPFKNMIGPFSCIKTIPISDPKKRFLMRFG